MSFGWSAGDIAQCVKLLIKIGKSLKDSGGSAAEYQDAVDFLKGVETTVQGVEDILQNHPNLTFQAAFQEHATNLIAAVTRFGKKTEGYETSLGVNPTTSEAKKAWKKVKLALFGHIKELRSDILYPQSIVNNLIGLQALDILVTLSEKPTLSPQQFQDSTEEISREFPILVASIEKLRSGFAEDLITIQQTAESNAQRNFDQIQQDLSEGNTLQRSSSEKAQEDAETQELWRSQVQISIAEIRAEAQKYFEALQEVKQAQEMNHQHSMQTLQVFSWKNAFRPATSRPVVKVIRKTVIASSQPTQSARTTADGSSRGGGSQGGNSKGGSSRGDSSRGSVPRGKNSRGGSSRSGGSREFNAPGGESSRGGSLGASHSRGLPKGGSNPRGGDCHGSSKGGCSRGGGNSRGGNTQGGSSRGSGPHKESSKGSSSRGGGNSRGGNTQGGNTQGGNTQGSNSHGSVSHKGSSKGSSSRDGGDSQGGNTRGGNTRGGNTRGGNSHGGSKGGASRSSNSQEGFSGGNNVRGGGGRGGSARGGSVRGGSVRGGSVRGGSARGGSARGGGGRGGSGQGGCVRGGNVQGVNVRGKKHND
ncbi:hypothetical protein BDZ45DRAFT_308812 [Acephala macrosclerotiorum]|nr:hypothetical protein BDZ45DRAFT_308812 [Acephala macrosclerotiorum]